MAIDLDTFTDDCVLWTGGKDRDGYGKMKRGGRWVKAHRCSYELHVGLIPKGMVVRHRCDTPGCVNPKHLALGTHQDNMDDMVARGRQAKGERHAAARLTAEQVRNIRRRLLEPYIGINAELAEEYGVNGQMISKIKHYQRWADIHP